MKKLTKKFIIVFCVLALASCASIAEKKIADLKSHGVDVKTWQEKKAEPPSKIPPKEKCDPPLVWNQEAELYKKAKHGNFRDLQEEREEEFNIAVSKGKLLHAKKALKDCSIIETTVCHILEKPEKPEKPDLPDLPDYEKPEAPTKCTKRDYEFENMRSWANYLTGASGADRCGSAWKHKAPEIDYCRSKVTAFCSKYILGLIDGENWWRHFSPLCGCSYRFFLKEYKEKKRENAKAKAQHRREYAKAKAQHRRELSAYKRSINVFSKICD